MRGGRSTGQVRRARHAPRAAAAAAACRARGLASSTAAQAAAQAPLDLSVHLPTGTRAASFSMIKHSTITLARSTWGDSTRKVNLDETCLVPDHVPTSVSYAPSSRSRPRSLVGRFSLFEFLPNDAHDPVKPPKNQALYVASSPARRQYLISPKDKGGLAVSVCCEAVWPSGGSRSSRFEVDRQGDPRTVIMLLSPSRSYASHLM